MLAEQKLRIKWALVCSVPADEDMKQLCDFGEWFISKLTTYGRRVGVYYDFEAQATFNERVQPGDLDACIITYERIHTTYPTVHVVIHVLPYPGSDEYAWMKSLAAQFGVVRQGILLENAKTRFLNVQGGFDDVFKNVAQWISRSAHKLSTSKNTAERVYDLRVGSGSEVLLNRQYIPHVMQTAVNNVLHGLELSVCRDESAVQVNGFPSRLNEYGVAQMFGDLTITGVTLKGSTALVVFANKFQAYQACELNRKALDCLHTLQVTPMSQEVLSQLEIRQQA